MQLHMRGKSAIIRIYGSKKVVFHVSQDLKKKKKQIKCIICMTTATVQLALELGKTYTLQLKILMEKTCYITREERCILP